MICIEDGNTRSVAAAIVTKQLLGTPDHLIGVPVTIKNDDLDRTFINLKLKKCGTVFATSKSLAMLLKALKRDKIDARFSHVWVSLDDFQKQKAEEKRRKQAAAEKKRQAAAKRKREAAAEKKRLASAEKVAKKRAKERKREFEKLNFTEKFVLEFVKPKRNEKKLSAITQEVTDEERQNATVQEEEEVHETDEERADREELDAFGARDEVKRLGPVLENYLGVDIIKNIKIKPSSKARSGDKK